MNRLLAAANGGLNVPPWFVEGVLAPLFVALVLGVVAIYLKTQNQVAVLTDRSDHERDDEDSDRGDRVSDLLDRVAALERDLRRERDDRAEDNRRKDREIVELREEVSSLRTELRITRNQMNGRSETP